MNHTDKVGESETRHDAIIQTLWARRGLIAATMGIFLLLGIIYLFVATPKWTATASVIYKSPPGQTNTNGLGEVASAQFLRTQAQVVTTRTNLTFALDRLMPEVQDYQTFANSPNPVATLQRLLSVEPGKNIDILHISLASPYRDEAKRLVDEVVNAYLDGQVRERRAAATELEKQRADLNTQIARQRAKMNDFQKDHRLLMVGSSDQDGVLMQEFNSLHLSLTNAELDSIAAESTYNEAVAALQSDPELEARVREMRTATATTATELATLRNELFVQQQRLQAVRRQYLDGHPAITALQQHIDQLTASYVNGARQNMLATKERERAIRSRFEDKESQVREMQVLVSDYRMLGNELTALEDQGRMIDAQLNTIRSEQTMGRIAELNESADYGEKPSSPQKPKALGLAIAFGLIAGCGLALVSDWRDQRLRSSEEIQASLGLQVLGVVPEMVGTMSQSHRGMKVYMDPTSDIAEAYRTVRTAMYFGLPEDARTVLVTSPSAGDGKSTLVSNLAISMAQAGRRVLVVDADFRLPVQHKIFDVQVDGGLSAVMAGQASLDDAIIPTAIDNLDLLPCGALPNNPSELLNSRAFAEVLGELAADYDCVLLDSPALMAVADARIASAWCDATVLVVHATRTNRKMAKMAREGLAAVGANIVGVVVNDVSLRDNQHGFYARFGYGVTPASREGTDADIALPSPRQGRRKALKADAGHRRTATPAHEAKTPIAKPAVTAAPAVKAVDESPVADDTEDEAQPSRLQIHHDELEILPADEIADARESDDEAEDAFIIADDTSADDSSYGNASFGAEATRPAEDPVSVEVPHVATDSDSLAVRESDAHTFESTATDADLNDPASTEDEADKHTDANDHAHDGHVNGMSIHEHIPGPRSPTDPAALAEQSRKLRDRMIALRHGRG